jgi:hypothetical protein
MVTGLDGFRCWADWLSDKSSLCYRLPTTTRLSARRHCALPLCARPPHSFELATEVPSRRATQLPPLPPPGLSCSLFSSTSNRVAPPLQIPELRCLSLWLLVSTARPPSSLRPSLFNSCAPQQRACPAHVFGPSAVLSFPPQIISLQWISNGGLGIMSNKSHALDCNKRRRSTTALSTGQRLELCSNLWPPPNATTDNGQCILAWSWEVRWQAHAAWMVGECGGLGGSLPVCK